MFNENNRIIRNRSGVFIVHFEYIWHNTVVFFVDFEQVMAGGVLYCLNLNSPMHFRVRSRSPVTFNTKLYVTTINNSFQPLTIFCHKELHLRCYIGLKLIIITWPTKVLKGIGGHPPPSTSWLSATLGKYKKLTLLDALACI